MKYLPLILILMSCAYQKAGYDRNTDWLHEYIEEAPGLTGNQLYDAANTYLLRENTTKILASEVSDRDAGKLTGYLVLYSDEVFGGSGVRFRYEIDTKDGKLRCRFLLPENWMRSNGGYWSRIRSIKAFEELKPTWDAIPDQIIDIARDDW